MTTKYTLLVTSLLTLMFVLFVFFSAHQEVSDRKELHKLNIEATKLKIELLRQGDCSQL